MRFTGSKLKIETFGFSHDKEVGVIIKGFPAGFEVDEISVYEMLERRRPGTGPAVSQRNEADVPLIVSGIISSGEEILTASGEKAGIFSGGITDGCDIKVVFENKDVKNTESDADYIPRPGHGDFTYYMNTGKFLKGASSARATVGICFAGALCKQYLAEQGIFINSRLLQLGELDVEKSRKKDLEKYIEKIKAQGDSVGGLCECSIIGLTAGFGNPGGEKLESKLAAAIFNLPGIKGLEFGLGFEAAMLKGSEMNDAFVIDNGKVRTKTNNCGGVLGGLASGSPVVMRAVFKPTPSIRKEQESVNLKEMRSVKIKTESRNDPCIAIRGRVLLEAAAAIAICDMMPGAK